MTDHDVDIDPEIEAQLRATFAAIAATSHMADDTPTGAAQRRWPIVAAIALALGGLAAIVVAARPDGPELPASQVPSPNALVTLPSTIEYVAVSRTNDESVMFEALDVDTARLLGFTVSRRAIEAPADAVALDELGAQPADPDSRIALSLPDGRLMTVSCLLLAPGETPACAPVDPANAPDDVRNLAHQLAAIPPDQLPSVATSAGALDRMSVAASAAYDTMGDGASDGEESHGAMVVTIGRDGTLEIRAAGPLVSAADPSIRTAMIGDVTITWTTMPDGAAWTVVSRPPADPNDHSPILDRIRQQLADGTAPTYPVVTATVPPETPATALPDGPISALEALKNGERRIVVDDGDIQIVARHETTTTAPYCVDLSLGGFTGPACGDRQAWTSLTTFGIPSGDGTRQLVGQIVPDSVTAITTSDGRTITPVSNVWYDVAPIDSPISYVVHAADGHSTEPFTAVVG